MGKLHFPLFRAGIEILGDWNPQLMREIQGRIKLRNVLITILCSITGQGVFLFWWYRTLYLRSGTCEIAEFQKTGKECVQAGTHYFLVNWQEWWLAVFVWGCILLMFSLVVGGTFLLISDLSKEEHRGTLTFISLSPQTAQSILWGKLMGVPILIFLAVLLMLPLHYGSGLAAQISFVKIVSFDVLLLGSCVFFYSLALLFGLVGHWLSGFQSWLGSAGVFILLMLLKENSITRTSVDWLCAFSPTVILPYVTNISTQKFQGLDLPLDYKNILEFQWFNIPLGRSGLLVFLFVLANLGVWTRWLWQPLQRRFRNPYIPLLSKKQSYWATTSFMACILGFSGKTETYGDFEVNMPMVLMAHLLWFLLLIVLLLPQYQSLEDWARFREQYQSAKGRRQRVQDLIWADNSPTWVAIVINLGITGISIMAWMFVYPEKQHMASLGGLLFNAALILILTLFNQVVLLKPLANRNLWTTVTLLGPTILPIFLLTIFGVSLHESSNSLFMLTPLAFVAIENITVMRALQILLLHVGAIVGLVWQLNRQLKRAGESTTKRLLQSESY